MLPKWPFVQICAVKGCGGGGKRRKARRAPISTMSSKSTQRVDKEAQRQTQQSEATGSLFCSGQLWRQAREWDVTNTHKKMRFKSEIEPDAAAPSSTVHVAYLSVHSSEKRGQTATRSTRRKKRGAPWPEQEVTKAKEKRRGKALKSTFPRFWLLSPWFQTWTNHEVPLPILACFSVAGWLPPHRSLRLAGPDGYSTSGGVSKIKRHLAKSEALGVLLWQ